MMFSYQLSHLGAACNNWSKALKNGVSVFFFVGDRRDMNISAPIAYLKEAVLLTKI
jgi:hypothetical protein